jgi:hypothetical protein
MKLTHYIALLGALSLVGCHSINQYLNLQDDNLFEEAAENVVETLIQAETGFRPDLDFTP